VINRAAVDQMATTLSFLPDFAENHRPIHLNGGPKLLLAAALTKYFAWKLASSDVKGGHGIPSSSKFGFYGGAQKDRFAG